MGGEQGRAGVRDIRDYLGRELLFADGSTGTALQALAPEAADRIPVLALERPDLVESLHRAYFAAGSDIVETATFTASAKGLARFAQREDPASFAYRVNRAAAELALRAARDADSGRARWVAGSMGPGGELPSLGSSSWAELRDSYLPQARGLADGGVDFAIVETCQDPLQAKAALAALAHPKGGRGLRAIVSATVESSGRLLAGTSPAAFVAIIAPFGPLALGMNCSGGPDELAQPFAELAAQSPFPLCFMPNAGIPTEDRGETRWPLGAEDFAARTAAIARRHGVSIVGGCCGTGVEHIGALVRRLADRPRPSVRPPHKAALASLYEAQPIGPKLFKIGERANSAGSASFASLLDAGDFDSLADAALEQESSGARAIDLHLARPGRQESRDLAELASLLAPRSRAALCLDSSDPEAMAAALPLLGGRPLLNSANLGDLPRARRVFELAREFGAAVVCLAVGPDGPASTADEKARVCAALYELAIGDYGLRPESLFFDPLAFALAAAPPRAGKETLRSIAAVKAACPGSFTLLGVGNVSYGLPPAVRPLVTAVFLDMAREAGLDAAILDTAGLPDLESVSVELLRAARDLILEEAPRGQDPMAVLLNSRDYSPGL